MALTRSLPTALLGASSVILAVLIVLEAGGALAGAGPAALPPIAQPPPATGKPAAAPVRTAALSEAVLTRPLFSAARRPPAAQTDGAEPSAAAPDQLPRVTGLVISGAGKSVLFAGAGGAKPIIVTEGGHLGGFTIRAIGPEGVTVVSAAGTQIVHPSFDANAAPPAAPALTVPANYPSLQDIFKNGPPPSAGTPVPGLAPYVPPRPRAAR